MSQLRNDGLNAAAPRWRRRKDARPAEILSAALEVFATQGFAAAKLDEVARRASVAKGTIYLHFTTKEELFQAVVRSVIAPPMAALGEAAKTLEGPLAIVVPRLMAGAADVIGRPHVGSVVRLVIGEARAFPDLARIWHDEVVAPMLDALVRVIARAQARGEVREGDARLYAFSLMGPLLMGVLFGNVFAAVSPDLPDLSRLAEQHGRMVLHGLLARP